MLLHPGLCSLRQTAHTDILPPVKQAVAGLILNVPEGCGENATIAVVFVPCAHARPLNTETSRGLAIAFQNGGVGECANNYLVGSLSSPFSNGTTVDVQKTAVPPPSGS